MGTYGGPRADRYIATFCNAVSHSEIHCKSVHGSGWNHTIQVTVVGQTGPISHAHVASLRYATPTIEKIEGPGAKLAMTKGGQLLEITGKNFGPVGPLQGYIIYGHATARSTEVNSCGKESCSGHGNCESVESSCECLLGWAGETCNTCFDDELNDLICDERRDVVFQGFKSHTLGGPRRDDLVFEAVDCRVTSPNVQIKCLSGEGTGKDHFWVLHIDGITSVPTFGNNSYAIPVVIEYTGDGAEDVLTEGGQPV